MFSLHWFSHKSKIDFFSSYFTRIETAKATLNVVMSVPDQKMKIDLVLYLLSYTKSLRELFKLSALKSLTRFYFYTRKNFIIVIYFFGRSERRDLFFALTYGLVGSSIKISSDAELNRTSGELSKLSLLQFSPTLKLFRLQRWLQIMKWTSKWITNLIRSVHCDERKNLNLI